MDHDGVEEPADKVMSFRSGCSMIPSTCYGIPEGTGPAYVMYKDLIDLKPVDWIELVDRDEHTYRIAVQRENHLMVRFTVITQDSTSRERTEEVTSYSNYHPLDGVQTPLQVTRTRNDRRILQAFYDTCSYNPNLPADFFTRAGLEQRFNEVGSRGDKKKADKAKHDRD